MAMVKWRRVIQLLKTPRVFLRKLINKVPKNIKRAILRFPKEDVIQCGLEKLIQRAEIVFIFPQPSCPWGYLFQRPQQLARALAKKGNCVLYMVDTTFAGEPDWSVRGIQELAPNLYLYNDGQEGRILLDEINKQREKFVVWQYWPNQSTFVRKMSEKVTKIYDCIDHLTTFNDYPGIQEDMQVAIEKADIVIATAKSILEEVGKIRQDCFLVPNGVTLEDFTGFKKRPWEELDELRKNSNCLVGYYGAIAEWFDFDLVDYVANQNPTCTFLLVGEVYPSVEKRVELLKRNGNIIMLPRIPYRDIPQLLSAFDVAMLPFLINVITLSTSPVKVFEYMAGGKIVVSTNLPEIVEFSYVFTAGDKELFNSGLRKAMSLKDDVSIKKEQINLSQHFTWSTRVEKVLSLVKRGETT